MKNSLYKTALLFLLMALTVPGFAKRGDVEKKKVIEKTFKVNDGTKLNIGNSFGKVHVNVWDQKSFSVTVEVIARKRNEDRAQQTLDKVDIDIEASSSEVSVMTNIKGQMNNNNNEGFEVNYVINMPSGNPLELKNSFGDVYIGDRNGKNDLKISYCDLKIGKLTGKSEMKISFSDGSIDEIGSGDLVLKYSDVNIGVLGVSKVHQEFSDINIDKAETINLTSKYGEMNIDEANGIKGSVSFSGFKLGKLGVEIDLKTSYSGNFRIEKIAKDFQLINLEGKFGEFKLAFADGTNASFDIETKFCDFKYDDNIEMNYRVQGDFKGEYRGKMGNGDGGAIRIKSSYGDVKFY
ncbi:MAG: hypothetical protein JXR07_12920 [Reichenbachiella sp.]